MTAELVRYCRDPGGNVDAYKPMISGFNASAPEVSDSAVIFFALGRGLTREEIVGISPCRLKAPLFPNQPNAPAALEFMPPCSRRKERSTDSKLAPPNMARTSTSWRAPQGIAVTDTRIVPFQAGTELARRDKGSTDEVERVAHE